MDRIEVRLEDLDALVQLSGALAAPANHWSGFEPLLVLLGRLMPFEHCILWHERRSPRGAKSYRQEFALRPALDKPVRVWAGRELFSVEHFLDEMARSQQLDSAFAWTSSERSLCGSSAGGGSQAACCAGSGGIGGLASASGQGSDCTTLLLLLQADPVCVARHVALMNAVMRPLHRSLQQNNDFATEGRSVGVLTTQEAKVMRWVVEGKTSWEIGMILSISERTVKFHLANTYAKLNVVNRVQAVSLVSRARQALHGETSIAA